MSMFSFDVISINSTKDPIAEILPWHIGILSAHMKKTMDDNKWMDGHLLIHVHKRFALSDAAVMEGLAMGCTGIWCAVCEEGKSMKNILCSPLLAYFINNLSSHANSQYYLIRWWYGTSLLAYNGKKILGKMR